MKRWLVPVAVAAAVLMLLGGMWWFGGPGGRGGEGSFAGGTGSSTDGSSSDGSAGVADPDTPVGSGGGVPSSRGTDQPGSEPGFGEPGFPGSDDPPLDPPTVEPAPPVHPLAVVIDSYYLHDDRRMSVNYTIGVPECYGTIAEPKVEETASAVTITLTRVPPKDVGDIACIDIALLKTVDIQLEVLLGDRVVLDGSYGDAVVKRRPVPGTAPLDR